MSFSLADEFQKAEHTLVRVKARRHIAGKAEKIKAGEKKGTLKNDIQAFKLLEDPEKQKMEVRFNI